MTIETNHSLFHPLEISICGHSGTGKTTLIRKLIEIFSSEKYSMGYIKHDAHKFEMDRPGKDTFIANQAGASSVAISSPNSCALILDSWDHKLTFQQNFVDSDIVLIEGYKNSLSKKILMWSGSEEDQKLLDNYLTNTKSSLIAIIGSQEKGPTHRIPYFQRDDLKNIYIFLKDLLKKDIHSRPLYGLVLAGGHSRRMRQDKTMLSYHGKPQYSYLYEILDKITDKAFISCRTEQSDTSHFNKFNLIEDRYLGFGPVGGILSAFHKHPSASWLVVACDMPFIDKGSLEYLIKNRNPYRIASCFYNKERKWPEPLCTIYEPKAALKLGQYLAIGYSCPRKVLINSNVYSIDPPSTNLLSNINTPIELESLRNSMKSKETLL